jgi:hypothetical protein
MLAGQDGCKFKWEFKDSDDELDDTRLGDAMEKGRAHLDEMKKRRATLA